MSQRLNAARHCSRDRGTGGEPQIRSICGAAPLFGRDEDVELIRSFISQAAGARPSGGGEWGRLSPTRGGERTCSTTAASEEGTACALLIETRAAIGNIEEIRKVEGIDCLTIAPFDLSTELGVSGHLDVPGLVEAITRAERVIGEAGIAPGGAALTQEQTHRLLKKGYRLLWHAFDVLVLKQFVLADGAMAIHLTHSCFRLHGPPRECPGR